MPWDDVDEPMFTAEEAFAASDGSDSLIMCGRLLNFWHRINSGGFREARPTHPIFAFVVFSVHPDHIAIF
jgi:hypothetical protein